MSHVMQVTISDSAFECLKVRCQKMGINRPTTVAGALLTIELEGGVGMVEADRANERIAVLKRRGV